MSTIKVRSASPEDFRFVHSSWHSTAWHTARKEIDWEVYQKEMDAFLDRILVRSRVLVAYEVETPDEILGYTVSEPDFDTLHFVYVKGPYRGMGIGTGLVRNKYTSFTQPATSRAKVFLKKKMGLKFNPYPEFR